MAHTTASLGKTAHIVRELNNLFSNTTNIIQLEKIIPNLGLVQSFLSKLHCIINIYERQGHKIDQQTDCLEQLKEFKKIIEEIINRPTHDFRRLVAIGHYVSAIPQSYKLLLEFGQTLEEINEMIARKVENSLTENKKEIGTLIVLGIDKKIPNNIYFDTANPNDNGRKLKIIETYYGYFIEYILYIRESLDMMLNDNNYRLELKRLQSKLLETEPSDIEKYFVKIKSKMMNNPGYSTEILLEYLAENIRIHISISNNSIIYYKHFIEIFQVPLKAKCMESLSNLTFKLNTTPFLDLFKEVNKDNLVFKSIYDKGIQLYLSEYGIASNSQENVSNNRSSATAKDAYEQVKTKFKSLFSFISTDKTLLNQLRDLIIDENNSIGTHFILGDIYGLRIRNLDFSDEDTDVKYCFNYHFFKSLSYPKLDDINGSSEFNQLLFYIHTCADKDALKFTDSAHEAHLWKLKQHFSSVYNHDNSTSFNALIEFFKMLINIGTFKFRLDRVKLAISKLEKDDIIKIKATFLKDCLDLNTQGREIYLQLARSFSIDLIKHVIIDRTKIINKLREYNSNFNLVIKYRETLNASFDIETELNSGFSIPYYLSAILTADPNYNEEINGIFMSILFKVFTCSSENDKEVFLKNKKDIRQEFNKLHESVKRLIVYYDASGNGNYRDHYKQFRDTSIQHILDGFSEKNQDSLSERKECARAIIDNFINYNSKKISQILEINQDLKDEVLNIFNAFMKRKDSYNSEAWRKNTSKLRDQIDYLHAYHRYKEKDFDEWFKRLNPDQGYKIILENRETIKQDFLIHHEAFESLQIKYLQHNQTGALALIHDYLSKPTEKNGSLFIKIGTGQGKSLAIAETARRIIENNRNATNPKVFVITCYDHLAKRDHENYEKYYKHFDIRTMYCSSSSLTEEFCSKDMIYADLETYFSVLRKEGHNRLVNGTLIKLPDIKNTVLIMDEFDSLILDSDEIRQYVHNFDVHIENPNTKFDRQEDVEKLFDKEFIIECNKNFPKIFERWWKDLLEKKIKEDKNERQKTVQDSLGKTTNFATSLLNYLKKNKKAHFVHYYWDPLVFYSQFKQVIGFSGSIEEKHLSKFQQLFNNERSHYYDIPPFFGETNLKNNRTFSNDPGKVYENSQDFLYAIKNEIRGKYKEQPILIFADSWKKQNEDESDYEQIRKILLEAQGTFLKDRKIIEIQTEDAIAENIHKIGKFDSITLATRIIGRGADIKVDKSIKKGLHLLLTYYPPRENIFIQMLGRTARQDEKGSYSIIVRKDKKFVEVADVVVSPYNKIIHELTEYFYRSYTSPSNNSNVALKWVLFSELIRTMNSAEIKNYKLEQLQEFIKRNIL
ncbi:unnamed protein product [Adineta steineri]|uniref:DEAD/DEAH-box helicase domain-containing protein n=1 Tax=Adineta steineri TaxID=433720 RepID=A0A815FGN7_9BILA|nr:unnamed protein product [Adineta steineri]CAF1318778.1 unnamed protein product [Adineta steineri]